MTTTRDRSRVKRTSFGLIETIDVADPTIFRFYVDEFSEHMIDQIGKHKDPVSRLLPPSDMDHSKIWLNPPTLNGDSSPFRFKNFPMGAGELVQDGYAHRGTYQRDVVENPDFVVKLLAQTHPFRTEYSVPTSIAEALDVGQLFKLTAKSFSELVGNAYLNYRFGWVQFVKDIRTLAQITKTIESRIKEFDSLSLHGGSSRKSIRLYSRGGGGIRYRTINSTWGVFCNANIYDSWTYQVTGSCRWRWKDGIKISLSKLEAFNTAVQTVFDLGELDASTIWNSIPWTWLCDYFIDIGSYLTAHEGEDFVEPFDICINRHYYSKNDIVPEAPIIGGTHRTLPGQQWLEIHARDVITNANVLPSFRLSLLSQSQVTVLLALIGKFHGSSYD